MKDIFLNVVFLSIVSRKEIVFELVNLDMPFDRKSENVIKILSSCFKVLSEGF